MNVSVYYKEEYGNNRRFQTAKKQSQSKPILALALTEGVRKREKSIGVLNN